jgi:hypothetical protein
MQFGLPPALRKRLAAYAPFLRTPHFHRSATRACTFSTPDQSSGWRGFFPLKHAPDFGPFGRNAFHG